MLGVNRHVKHDKINLLFDRKFKIKEIASHSREYNLTLLDAGKIPSVVFRQKVLQNTWAKLYSIKVQVFKWKMLALENPILKQIDIEINMD